MFYRERGLLAEGAKFLLMSLDVNFSELLRLDTRNDLKNFHYFDLTNPSHPDHARLSRHAPDCKRGDKCRWVTLILAKSHIEPRRLNEVVSENMANVSPYIRPNIYYKYSPPTAHIKDQNNEWISAANNNLFFSSASIWALRWFTTLSWC